MICKLIFALSTDGMWKKFLYLKIIRTGNLIKISILQNCEEDDDDVIEFFESYGMEFIQKIGRQFIFYMQSDDAKNPIELPRK